VRSVQASTEARRRRRTPAAAQAEIISAAEGLLRERPFRELTVDEVMRRTGLSRPSFYVYFRDRHDLVLRVVQHLQAELFTESNRWFTGEGPELAREALRGVVEVYASHAPVLRALADAAADDPDVETAYTQLVQSFIDVTARHIEAERTSGRVEMTIDPREVAKALIWMNERYLYLSFSGEPFTPNSTVVETLQCVWLRTLYGSLSG
jgi:AcrR family transcriptional regulator